MINLDTVEFIAYLKKFADLSSKGFKPVADAVEDDEFSYVLYDSDNDIIADIDWTNKKVTKLKDIFADIQSAKYENGDGYITFKNDIRIITIYSGEWFFS